MNIRDATDEELEAELARRRAPYPKPLWEIDWSPVTQMCEEYIAALDDGEREDDDFDHVLTEAVMKAVFGTDVYVWINKRAR